MKHQLGQAGCRGALTILLFVGFATWQSTYAVSPDNWPQWRGPNQSGAAPKADPPITWSESSNVLWKVKIPGDGTATPLVWDDVVFVQSAIPTGKKVEAPAADSATKASSDNAEGGRTDSGPRGGPGGPGGPRGPGGRGGGRFGGGPKPTEFYQFALQCLERKSGKLVWQQIATEEVPHEGLREGDGSYAANSGVTDGQHVWAYFGSRGVYCYDFKGNLIWSNRLGKMRVSNTFGEGSSPALYKDTLIINWDNEDGSFIIALDKNTGKQLWKEPREEGTSWSTPLVVEKDGKAEVVVDASQKIRSYDPINGTLKWECGGLTRNVIPSPVADADRVYCMSGFMGNSAMAIQIGRTGNIAGTDAIAWTYRKSTPYVPSPLLYNGKLYFCANNNAVLTCLDSKSGEVVFDAERIEGLNGVYASPVGAGGKIYLTGRNGATVVIKQGDKLEVLATNKLDDKIDASPAAVGKELFLRGRQYLYCIAEK
jgi:outer membrane protein assembly factor BamB